MSGLAYGAYKLPPAQIEKLSPNLALIETRQRQSFWDPAQRDEHRALRTAWLKKLSPGRYLTWDYNINARPEQAGRPVVYTNQIASDLRELKGLTLGEMIEIYDHPASSEGKFEYDPLALEHLNLYVTSRLWWDAGQSLDALLEDYFTSYYGTAAKLMRTFVEFSEVNWMHMGQDSSKIKKALSLLGAAKAAVDPRSSEGRRIERIETLMKPLRSLEEQRGRKRDTDLSCRVLEARQTGGKPMSTKAFDGQILNEYWTNVRRSNLSKLTPEAPQLKAATSFQIQREGSILHVGIICQEPNMAEVAGLSSARGDVKIFDGDHITLLIETASNSYYEIAVSPSGGVIEVDHGTDGKGFTWTSAAQIAVHRGENLWSVEIRLPITGEGSRMLDPFKGVDGAQPKDMFPWHFNVCRL